MQTTQGNMLGSLRAVKGFLDENDQILGDVVSAATRKKLHDAITELASHRAAQVASDLEARGSTQLQRALREALMLEHMRPIARIAKSELPTTPDVLPLRMPRGRPSAERLAGLAYGMADTAMQYSETFAAAGLPQDFAPRLKAAADAMIASVDKRRQSRGNLKGATNGMKVSLAKGRRVVGVIDAFVSNALKNDTRLLAKWDSIKRVQIVPVTRDETTEVTTA